MNLEDWAALRPLAVSSTLRACGLGTLLVLVGCEDGEQATVEEDAAVDAGAVGEDAGSLRSTPTSYRVSGKIVDFDERPITGAKVCIASHDEIPCALSDASGDYGLVLPVWQPTRPIAVHVSATGYLGLTLLLGRSPGLEPPPLDAFLSLWFPKIPLTDDARAAERLSAEAGFRYPAPERAFVEVDVSGAPAGSSVIATLIGSQGETLAPVYSMLSSSRESTYDPALTSTSNGAALFAEVPPGPFEVLLVGCMPSGLVTGAWYGSGPNAVAGVAVAGALTRVTALCRKADAP